VPTLTTRDYRAALDFLRFADEVEGVEPFSGPLLKKLRRLIPCDCVSYGDYAGPLVRRRNIRAAPSSRLPVPLDVAHAADALRHKYPLLLGVVPLGRAVCQSALMTRKEFHSSQLYEAVGRPLGIEYAMNLTLIDRGRVLGGFGFDESTRDFGDRDRQLLDLLAPHLVRLHRAARARAPRPSETSSAELLTTRQRQVVRLVADGLTNRQIAVTLSIAVGTVDKHLDNAYAKLGVSSRAAAAASLFKPAGGEAS
jgi:DNA-binding CsgD family transcriptional regulator